MALNRAVALAGAAGPRTGLAAVEEASAGGDLDDYAPLHATRAGLLARLGDEAGARAAYGRAAALTTNPAERDLLMSRA